MPSDLNLPILGPTIIAPARDLHNEPHVLAALNLFISRILTSKVKMLEVDNLIYIVNRYVFALG